MQEYRLSKISFGSYIKLVAMASFGMGAVFGVLAFIISLMGGKMTFNGQVLDYAHGILAGAGMIVMFPIIWGVISTMFAAITFPGLLLFIKILRGIKIKAVIENRENHQQFISENEDA